MKSWFSAFFIFCFCLPVFAQYKLKSDSAGVRASKYELIYAKPFHSRGRYALRMEDGQLSMDVFLSNARVILPRTGPGLQDSILFYGNTCRIAFGIPVLDSLKCHPRKKQFRFRLPLGEQEILSFINTPPTDFTILHGDQRFDFNIGIAHYTRIKNRLKWMLL